MLGVMQIAFPAVVTLYDLWPLKKDTETAKKAAWIGFSILVQNRLNYGMKKLARNGFIPLCLKTSGRVMVLAQASQRLADRYGYFSKEALAGYTVTALVVFFESKRTLAQIAISMAVGSLLGRLWSYGAGKSLTFRAL